MELHQNQHESVSHFRGCLENTTQETLSRSQIVGTENENRSDLKATWSEEKWVTFI